MSQGAHFLKTIVNLRMKWKWFTILGPSMLVTVILLLFVRAHQLNVVLSTGAPSAQTQHVVSKTTPVKSGQHFDWIHPSEHKPYPDIKRHPHLEFAVDLKKQRVFLRDTGKLLYTMKASTGSANTTPRGTFHIEAERGVSFYNPQEQLGARYYTSWYRHGVYLFHTVPTDHNGAYVRSEATKLGKKTSSHGCVRLSIADARWINKYAQVGMTVKIY